jgi:hypothetical protein
MDTKEDLLEELMRFGMQELLEPAADLMASVQGPIEIIVGLVDLHVRQHAKEQLLCMVGDTELRSLSPSRRREIVVLRDRYEAMWEGAIREGSEGGLFHVPDVKLAVFAVLEMCTGVIYWYAPNGRLTLDEISNMFVDMTLSLLGTAQG